jgi:hypothetical protein
LDNTKKIKTRYFNNILTFDGVPLDESKGVRELWNTLREDYADWVAAVRLKSFESEIPLVELLEWRGMSTWWINNLVSKDSEGDTRWLHRLMVMYFCNHLKEDVDVETDDRILKKSLNQNFPTITVAFRTSKQSLKQKTQLRFPKIISCLRWVQSLYISFERWLLVLGLNADKNWSSDSKNIIWFMTIYPSNWIKDDDIGWQDRHLVDAPLLDQRFQMESSYLVYISRYSKDLSISFFRLRKELRNLKEKAGRQTFFPESKLKVNDIIEVYWSTALEWIKFRRWKQKKKFKSLFTFAGMDLSIILMDHWEQSYFGMMQYCKLHGLATMRFLEPMEKQQTIVTYLELFIETRTDFHLKNKTKNNTLFYALQHSQESRNYGEAYNRESEFSQNGSVDNVHYCPMPDFFLVHGQQYKKILSEFYPNSKITTIGSLKVKQYLNYASHKNQVDINQNSILIKKNKIKLLVALSSNDIRFLLPLLSEWQPEEDIQIWMTSHPLSDREQIIDFINNDLSHLQIDLVNGISTWQLIPHANVLVCGYSNLIYESLLFKIPTAVLQPISIFSPREIDPRIPIFFDMKLFNSWLKATLTAKPSGNQKDESETFFFDYFFHPDGRADERMWKIISRPPNHADKNCVILKNVNLPSLIT